MKHDVRIAKLVERLKQYREDAKLSELFPWPIAGLDKLQALVSKPNWIQDIKACSLSNFKKTLALRKNIQSEMGDLDNEADKNNALAIATWIIKDWGGITRGTDDKLKACLKNAEEAALSDRHIPFDRIASWSKYLAFKYPTRFAIYDARVIYSLNWLLFRTESRPYFPTPPGRNSVLALLDYQIVLLFDCNRHGELATQLDEDIRNRAGGNSSFSKKISAQTLIQQKEYSQYCDLLRSVAHELYGESDDERLIKVEMMLFSLADREIASEVIEFYSTHCHLASIA